MDWQNQYRPERKTNWEDIANAIHDLVTVEDVLHCYYPSIPIRRHRCPCPIHNGKDFNFSFTRSGYKCFVCGASGDVIALVKEACELSTRADAMKRLNSDLNLHLPIDSQPSGIFSLAAKKRREEAEKRQKERAEWEDRYNALVKEYAEMDKSILFANPLSSEYVEAVKRIDYVAYLIDQHLINEPR